MYCFVVPIGLRLFIWLCFFFFFCNRKVGVATCRIGVAARSCIEGICLV